MHERLVDHIERVRAICDTRLSASARVRRVVASAVELVSEPVPLPDACRVLPAEGYGRHLLYRCPEHGFVVMALVWPQGVETPVHDHGGWGVVAVSAGRIKVTTYLREDDGACDGFANLVHDGEECHGPGAEAVATTLPPHDDTHKLENVGDDVAVTIHTYYAEMKSCRVFDLEQNTYEIRQLTYTTSQYAVA